MGRLEGLPKFILLSLGLLDFCGFAALSIMGPFFPHEVRSLVQRLICAAVLSLRNTVLVLQAALKGVSKTVSGLVFSAYALMGFIMGPTFGKLVKSSKKRVGRFR